MSTLVAPLTRKRSPRQKVLRQHVKDSTLCLVLQQTLLSGLLCWEAIRNKLTFRSEMRPGDKWDSGSLMCSTQDANTQRDPKRPGPRELEPHVALMSLRPNPSGGVRHEGAQLDGCSGGGPKGARLASVLKSCRPGREL
ncbi:hypothetical protein NHX12_023954 [Muraenolepis orangiensis]|uniref:Uncharacterized protein n=1 Tax=Muraenolepis orangiensis TaxID=630683 RepID=A0A9Q0ITA6_9TELE|nr:hypothetical protein NHX12_023954 [Muraenolepis orangiensis]